MARRRRKSHTDPVRRDVVTSIASLLPQREPLRAIEDRREFQFDDPILPVIWNPTAPASIIVTPTKRPQSDYVRPRYGFNNPPTRLGFAQPERVAVCARREQRREVIFAKRKAGKRGQRRARWNKFSDYSCK